MNNKLINYRKNIVMCIISDTEKNNWNLFGTADPDPHQNEAVPKH